MGLRLVRIIDFYAYMFDLVGDKYMVDWMREISRKGRMRSHDICDCDDLEPTLNLSLG